MTMTVQREPERVMNRRGGSVLGRKTILKSDHFPGCQNYRLMPQIEGAPNYRQTGSSHVHGVAIPTIDGIHNVLDHIGAQKNGKQKQVLWINLREEPVVYINGRPFVLREVERPFSNLEYTGINRGRVEQMEARLKEDIILEAARYENKILVTDELPDGQMVDQWEPVTQESIKTPLEVYEELHAEGYLVDYERVPITDEKSPKERDFDMLVHKILQADINAEIVFNCQMGRGRTTTGMVIATLGISRSNSIGKVLDGGAHVVDNITNSEEAMLRGEYAVIRSLIRVLEGGVECKRQVDKVIDSCSSMQNLREAIATYRNSILRQRDEMKREAALSFFMEYLERYYFLICFAVYLHTERSALLPDGSSQNNFVDWMRARPELYSILRRLLRRDPMGALGYATSKTNLVKFTSAPDDHPCDLGVVAAMRKGEVLGRQTVLKSDHCPGCQNLTLPERVEGAPNFREIPGFPVYGVANPTIDGIRAVIQRIASRNGSCPILWHNMREEPVVYINGKPFVLREVERPYKNMLEYTGIDRERVERMEARLKEDILREAELYGGTIMVIHETDDGQIFDLWEHVNPEVVQTPLEALKSLESEGLPVKYARVPITDGKAPKSSDFDTLAINIASAPKNAAFVFNCQMGQGRTTTGTVIACLVKLRIDYGRPIRVPHEAVSLEEVDSGSSSCEEAGSGSSPGASGAMRAKHGNKLHHTFGINDILLLRKVTRLFDNGIECREVLDAVIDRCAAMQNIRKAVLKYRKVFNQQNVEPRVRRVALNRGAEYLERYFRLIAFAAYLGSEAFDGFCGQDESKITFKTWLHRRPEVQALKWSIRLRPGRFFNIPVELRTPHESDHGDAVMEALVNTRCGSVLGKGSILKMYFYPGQRTSSRMQIPGAPHVHKVDGYPVYSMATPTIAGAKEMLKLLGAKLIGPGRTGKKVIVTDLREEAVVYINGVPFVLRELDQAVDTLKHVGITGPVVEHMEVRLKEDILAEVTQSGGRMLLHREELNPSTKHPNVIGYWENVLLDDVKTPAEVYAALSYEGYNIEYMRIPLTREREALAADVDAIQSCIDSSADYYLYVSHTGFGGVAYAMAITSLRLRADELSQSEKSELLDWRHLTLVGQEQSAYKSLDEEEPFEQGDYRDILSLTRVLMYGPQSKAEVDAIIDRRYFYLIAFRSYLFTTVKTTTGPNESGFTSWMEARPELAHLCDNLRLDK